MKTMTLSLYAFAAGLLTMIFATTGACLNWLIISIAVIFIVAIFAPKD